MNTGQDFSGLYFGLVLATLCLTGFLARQSWRQKEVPGVKYYFWLALAICSAALGEALSMTGATPGQALFWFNTRFVPFAVIPPLWLLFVLEYSGRGNWLSKKLGAGLFAVPVITAVMVLTSGRHGFWVKNEVEFIREGSF
nr:hypothetical protein [Desulfobacula sp.]